MTLAGVPQGASIEGFGRLGLVLVVASLLALLALVLSSGGLVRPLSTRGGFPEREGLELLFFPLAAVLAAMVRSRLGALTVVQTGRMGHALPLLASGALVALVWYLGWSWVLEREWHEPERLLGAGLVGCVGVAGCVLFPRHTALLAGAAAAPALYGAAVLAFPGLLLDTVDQPSTESTARNLTLAAAGVLSLALLVVGLRLSAITMSLREDGRPSPMAAPEAGLLSLLVGRIRLRLRPHVIGLAAWGAALGLVAGVCGHLAYFGFH